MERLLALAGGQQLRSTDWRLMQESARKSVREVISGLRIGTSSCIISGLEITIDPDKGTITVGEGYFFDGEEICYCGGGGPWDLQSNQDNQNLEYNLYFSENFVQSEFRTFKDLTEKEVYETRQYDLNYSNDPQLGWILYPARLLDVITLHVVENIPSAPEQVVKRYLTALIDLDTFEQSVTIIPAPGSNKAIKLIGITAKIVPTDPVDAAGQTLNFFYGVNETDLIGQLPSTFLESTSTALADMEYTPGAILQNQAIRAVLSDKSKVDSGFARIMFYCYYAIITL